MTFQIQAIIWPLLLLTALVAGCMNPGHNNNPSQQVTNPKLGCPAATEFFSVYFSLRLQPAPGPNGPLLIPDVYRAYCNELPLPGKVFLTIDLNTELSARAIGVQVFERTPNDDARSAPGERLLDIPRQAYPKGVIEVSFDVGHNGGYAIVLTRASDNSQLAADTLTIPITVGVNVEPAKLAGQLLSRPGVTFVLAILGFMVLGLVLRGKSTPNRSNPP